MKHLHHLFLITTVILSAFGCASQTHTLTENEQADTTIGYDAKLYVFNISGPTLIPQNQKIFDNGKLLTSLPRNKYKIIKISGGAHKLGFQYRKRPVVNLNAIKGKTYYVVIGYNPAKSWAFPLAGDPLVIKQLTEEEAQPLIEELKLH